MEKNQHIEWVLADAFAIAEVCAANGEQVSVREIWNEMLAENTALLSNQGGACE